MFQSNPETLYARNLQSYLLPHHTYGFNSGGEPLNIPDLTVSIKGKKVFKEPWQQHSLKILNKCGAQSMSYKLSMFAMAYPFFMKLSAWFLEDLMTYAVGQLCI